MNGKGSSRGAGGSYWTDSQTKGTEQEWIGMASGLRELLNPKKNFLALGVVKCWKWRRQPGVRELLSGGLCKERAFPWWLSW